LPASEMTMGAGSGEAVADSTAIATGAEAVGAAGAATGATVVGVAASAAVIGWEGRVAGGADVRTVVPPHAPNNATSNPTPRVGSRMARCRVPMTVRNAGSARKGPVSSAPR